MPNPRLSSEIIAAAIEGYESQRSRLDAKIAELRQMLTGAPPDGATKTAAAPRKRRRLSAAGRKAIADAARKRWAAIREGKTQSRQSTGSKTARKSNAKQG